MSTPRLDMLLTQRHRDFIAERAMSVLRKRHSDAEARLIIDMACQAYDEAYRSAW